MNKGIILTIISMIVISTFSGCGDDASFENSSSSTSSKTTTIDIDVACTTPATISTYIELKSGDTIVENTSDTTVETYHDANGTKSVCLVSGSASIVR